MPLYEYECKHCEFNSSIILDLSDRDTPVGSKCPLCFKQSIIRIPSSGSFKINGYSEENGYNKASTKRK